MKKILLLAFVISLANSCVFANEQINKIADVKPTQQQMDSKKMKANRDMAFENRLGLTELQKLKAREIRRDGHEKLKPLFEEVKNKKQEAEMVRRSRMAVQMQEEKLMAIDKDLLALEKQINQIRKSNMKEFESILTKQQKRTLNQMKKEGRKRFHSAHPMMKMPTVKR